MQPRLDVGDTASESSSQSPNAVRAAYAEFSGPLPHPAALQGYKQVLEDAPERILKMAETEAANRQHIERWIVKGDVIRSIVGVLCAFTMGVLTLCLGAYLVLQNHDVAGTLFAGAGLTSLVSAFIYGTRYLRSRQEDETP